MSLTLLLPALFTSFDFEERCLVALLDDLAMETPDRSLVKLAMQLGFKSSVGKVRQIHSGFKQTRCLNPNENLYFKLLSVIQLDKRLNFFYVDFV